MQPMSTGSVPEFQSGRENNKIMVQVSRLSVMAASASPETEMLASSVLV